MIYTDLEFSPSYLHTLCPSYHHTPQPCNTPIHTRLQLPIAVNIIQANNRWGAPPPPPRFVELRVRGWGNLPSATSRLSVTIPVIVALPNRISPACAVRGWNDAAERLSGAGSYAWLGTGLCGLDLQCLKGKGGRMRGVR